MHIVLRQAKPTPMLRFFRQLLGTEFADGGPNTLLRFTAPHQRRWLVAFLR